MGTVSLLSSAAGRLEGKVAMITVGASGIGESTARLFTQHGAKVIIADIQESLGHAVSKDLGTSSSFLHCDVTNEEHVKRGVDFAISKYRKLDIMFNNAGIVGPLVPRIMDTERAHFEEVVRVNLVGPFLGTKHAAQVMVPVGQGSTGSVMGVEKIPHAYVASKLGVLGLMKNTAVELGRFGIRVNCISPHVAPTPLSKKAFDLENEDEFDAKIYSYLRGSICRKEDVANAALYLVGVSKNSGSPDPIPIPINSRSQTLDLGGTESGSGT